MGKRAVFSVRGMDCATCGFAIEKKLKNVEGVDAVGTSIMLNRVFVDYDESKVGIVKIMQAIKETGYSGYLSRRIGER
jgi:copper chaperone CopZ